MKINKSEKTMLLCALYCKYMQDKKAIENIIEMNSGNEKSKQMYVDTLEHLNTTYNSLKEKLENEVPTDWTRNDSLEQAIDNYFDAYETYEAYADQCNVVEEYDDYRSWAIIEDAPDADFFIADMLEYVSNELGELSNSDREYCSKYFRDRFDSWAQDKEEAVIEHYSD